MATILVSIYQIIKTELNIFLNEILYFIWIETKKKKIIKERRLQTPKISPSLSIFAD